MAMGYIDAALERLRNRKDRDSWVESTWVWGLMSGLMSEGVCGTL